MTIDDNAQLAFFDKDQSAPALFRAQTGNWADEFGRSLKTSIKFPKRPRVLGLFSGAGGLDIGFEDCGFDIVETVEFEKQFVATLNANSGSDKYFEGAPINRCIDIREYTPSLSDIDFIIGGPPCQSFSAAGARASGVAGTKDERGELFREYVRILKLVRPKGFLFENVYRIVGANGGRDWQEITGAFFEAGYQIVSRILDAADYGVPQHRERLIIVGVRKDLWNGSQYRFPRPTHGPDSLSGLHHVSAASALADLTTTGIKSGLSGRYGKLLDEIPPGLNYSFFTERMGHPQPIFSWRSKFSDFLYKADPARPVRTIKASGGQYTGPFHWENRPFTVDELKRLQTFPDAYVIAGARGLQTKQIGNSVPPQFARILALSVAEKLFKAEIPSSIDYLMEADTLSFRRRKSALTAQYESSATRAIALLEKRQQNVLPISYYGHLTEDFTWEHNALGDDRFHVEEQVVGTELHIRLDCNSANSTASGWKLYLSPKNEWVLPYTGVYLSVNNDCILAYTACWKAFEYFLTRNDIKADLVQLFNYYQYESSIAIEPLHVPPSPAGVMIASLSQGRWVNRLFRARDLASECSISDDHALAILLDLKKSGFEVRSAKTNAAITFGDYLIPYGFPTLTRMSVQRAKELI